MKSFLEYILYRIIGLKKKELPLLVEQEEKKVRYGKTYKYYGVKMLACKHTCHGESCEKCDKPQEMRDLLKRFPNRMGEKGFKHCSECDKCAIRRLDWPCRCYFPDGVCQGYFKEV